MMKGFDESEVPFFFSRQVSNGFENSFFAGEKAGEVLCFSVIRYRFGKFLFLFGECTEDEFTVFELHQPSDLVDVDQVDPDAQG